MSEKIIDLSKYDKNNIESVAKLIRDSIKEYQKSLEEIDIPYSQTLTTNYALKKVMDLGKGQFNPHTIMLMIKMEGEAWDERTTLQA